MCSRRLAVSSKAGRRCPIVTPTRPGTSPRRSSPQLTGCYADAATGAGRERDSEAFLSAVDRLLPAPGQESEVIFSLARFFCSALDNRAWSAAVTVAEAVIGNETLRPFREAILDRCLARLARHPPGKARDFDRWAEFSQKLVSEKVSESVRDELFARVAKSVGPFLPGLPTQQWPHILSSSSSRFSPASRSSLRRNWPIACGSSGRRIRRTGTRSEDT
jgi:hypothetical protein